MVENGELITLVSNGKENGTLHKYKLFDDDDDGVTFKLYLKIGIQLTSMTLNGE